MVKVLFVCLGNICRSPLAEALFRHKIEEKQLSNCIVCDSAGITWHHVGQPPDERMRRVANDRGITISSKARLLRKDDLFEFDYVLPMDGENLDAIDALRGRCGGCVSKIKLMREFDTNAESKNVPDPYYGGEEGFGEVFDILNRSTENLLDFVVKEHYL